MNPANYLSDCCGDEVKYDKENEWLVCLGCFEPCAGKPRTLGIMVSDKVKIRESVAGEGA